ncbi:DMT family transporter [Vibrio sp. WXL103]|uniref:DMT family transporter n=1 Tax=Vibrio sp. WXL103 TaxID=3450710 RepID=UPI003EC6537C
MIVRAIPFIFVFLWASGFVGARFGLQYAEPATLLSIRMAFNILLFLVIATWLRHPIPKGKSFWHSCVVGILIHGFYLGGTFFAISLGMPAGLSSLLVGIQPILTAVLLVLLASEELKPSQWFGLALGFVGIAMVLMGKMEWQSDLHKTLAVCMSLASLLGITVGTLYQKKYCQRVDMVGGAAVQYMAALAVFLPIAVHFETMQVQWTKEFILTLVWMVVVLSCVAILLLLYMVKNGAASSVAAVFYLVPPTTALQAWLAFGEAFDWMGLVGFVLAAKAVYLVAKKPELPTLKSKFAKQKRKVCID